MAVVGMPQLLEGMGMERVPMATREGGPKAPAKPPLARVSMMRQGVTEMNWSGFAMMVVMSLA